MGTMSPQDQHSPDEPSWQGRGGLSMATHRHGDAQVLRVAGELDAANAHELTAAITTVRAAHPPGVHTLVLDLAGITFFSAAGLGALFVAQLAFRDALDLRIVASSRIVLRTLDLSGSQDRFALYDSVEDALDAPREHVDDMRAHIRDLERRLAGQPVIEQAKGMLIQNFGLADEQAFGVLVTLSQDTNTKLRDVAERIVGKLTGTVSSETADATVHALADLRERLRED
jgi:anti-anti-sigma factor